MTSVTRPDSNTVSISYSGNCATVTDEAGKARESCSDGLGRLTQVYEDPSGLDYLTTYAYDALNDLTSVTQGSQTRTYSYDALGRLTAATTPESGTANFYYTTSGGGLCAGDPSAVCRRTDARGTTTTYTYDALNRLTQKTYSDSTPTALFYYDESSVNVSGTVYATPNGLGRLTHTATAQSGILQSCVKRQARERPRYRARVMCCRLSGDPRTVDRRDKAVPPRERLHIAWALRGVTQNLPHSFDRCIDTVFEVNESISRPQSTPDFLTRNHFARPLEEHGEDFKRLSDQPEP